MTTLRLAVPTDAPGGLTAQVSPHFGHCDGFTLVTLKQGEVVATDVLPTPDHHQGGCMVPVQLLASHDVAAVVVSGIGRRPLMGFDQVGLAVYACPGDARVLDVVTAFLADRLPRFSVDDTCGGGDHTHQA